ncbi:hypothetical protein C8A03DRAFT_38081 [Achaetomium macrosporum]|uniref:F-box domain-containing protein n=1 Tax=Achaetomium macrosporum TaxID=79813 RepID=A0AAN7HAS7_9PEZI|nr:hypothetical protein C8A03DRAFT_38081 [Achaetomium macrosporum]
MSLNLETIPVELLLHVAYFLDYGPLLSLSSTSRALHAVIDPDALCSLEEKFAFYQHAERHFPQHAGHLVCFSCWRFRSPDQFGDSKRHGRHGKFSHDARRQRSRFCWECGVTKRLYQHLKGVKRCGVTYYPCHQCGRALTAGRKCVEWTRTADPACSELRYASPWLGETWADGVPRQRSRLERLFEAHGGRVRERVLGMLGYLDLIRLKRTSRYFRRTVDPVRQCRDVYGMWKFVMARVEMWWWFHSGSKSCFWCFRIRSISQFSREQWNHWGWSSFKGGEYWRQRCWECLRRFYHPQLADTEARERFNRQVLCDVCKCLRYRGEECQGCVVRNDAITERERRRRQKLAAKSDYDFWEGGDVLLLVTGDSDVGRPEPVLQWAIGGPPGDDLSDERKIEPWFRNVGPEDEGSVGGSSAAASESDTPGLSGLGEGASSADLSLISLTTDVQRSNPEVNGMPLRPKC